MNSARKVWRGYCKVAEATNGPPLWWEKWVVVLIALLALRAILLKVL